MENVKVEVLTNELIADELTALRAKLGMTVDRAKDLAAANALEPEQYDILCRIEDLEWLKNT